MKAIYSGLAVFATRAAAGDRSGSNPKEASSIMRGPSIMRSIMVIVASLLGFSMETVARADIKTDLANCLATAKTKAKAAGYTNKATNIASKEMDECSSYYDKEWDKQHPKTFTPDSSYYEFKTWEANEDYSRDVEAINRDYDLRRAGVLP
jgi:hypothetical protein